VGGLEEDVLQSGVKVVVTVSVAVAVNVTLRERKAYRRESWIARTPAPLVFVVVGGSGSLLLASGSRGGTSGTKGLCSGSSFVDSGSSSSEGGRRCWSGEGASVEIPLLVALCFLIISVIRPIVICDTY